MEGFPFFLEDVWESWGASGTAWDKFGMQTTLTLLLSCSFHAPALLLLYSSLAPASALSYSCPTPALILLQPHYCFAPALLLPCSRSYHSQFGSFHHHHHLITFFGTVRVAFYGTKEHFKLYFNFRLYPC